MFKRCLFALAGGVAGIAASFPVAAAVGAGDWLVQTVAVAGAVLGITVADRPKPPKTKQPQVTPSDPKRKPR